MNKLFTITEPYKQFVRESTGEAIKKLASVLDLEYWGIPFKEINLDRLDKDSEVKLIVVEAAYLDYCCISVRRLKEQFPNSKVVVLGSDTVYYCKVTHTYQFDHPKDCDLFLDQMDCVIEHYTKQGITTDFWLWTCSQWMIDKASEYVHLDTLTESEWLARPNDVMSVMAPWTIHREGSYRNRMVKSIQDAGFTFIQGSKDHGGHEDKFPQAIYKNFSESKINLMTCSHDNESLNQYGCMKGWRDAFGILFGCLGLSDNSENYLKTYVQNGYCPYYKFGDFNDLNDKIKHYIQNPQKSLELNSLQHLWLEHNTIEKQLEWLIKSYKLI